MQSSVYPRWPALAEALDASAAAVWRPRHASGGSNSLALMASCLDPCSVDTAYGIVDAVVLRDGVRNGEDFTSTPVLK